MVRRDIGTAHVIMELSNMKKKKNRALLNVTKVRLEVMLVLPNVIMELSNVKKKK